VTLGGRLFQARAAATGTARSPTVVSLVRVDKRCSKLAQSLAYTTSCKCSISFFRDRNLETSSFIGVKLVFYGLNAAAAPVRGCRFVKVSPVEVDVVWRHARP